MVTSYSRGHEIMFKEGVWVYKDSQQPVSERTCKRCGRWPTIEGYDACLGLVEGVQSACCGHGVEEPYMK